MKIIEISIEGTVFPSIRKASLALGLSVDQIRVRLDSDRPEWSEWTYLCDPEVGVVKPEKYSMAFAYYLVHKPTGAFYVGSTWDMVNRRAGHLHELRKGKHYNKKLQDLWNEEKDESLWDWKQFVFNTREEAYAEEQRALTKYKDSHLLLNSVTNAKSPISSVMDREGFKEMRSLAMSRSMSMENLTPEERGEFSKKMSQNAFDRWNKEGKREAWKGGGNPFAKKVMVDGMVYPSMKDAVTALGISEKTIRTRANSDSFPNYTFDVEGNKSDHRWATAEDRAKISGSRNPSAKSIVIDGVTYYSMKEAREKLKMDERTMRKRLNSPRYPNYKFGSIHIT